MNEKELDRYKEEFEIEKAGLPDFLNRIYELLTDERRIKKSLVFPFRFLSAYTQIEAINGKHARQLLKGLSEAIDISCNNVPFFEGETLVVADFSGSMGDGVASLKGQASVLGTVLAKSNNADFMAFATEAEYVNIISSENTMATVESLLSLNTGRNKLQIGFGTDLNSVFRKAEKFYDRIIILSDMQAWMGHYPPTKSFNNYKHKFKANPFVYSIDLSGYGTSQFPEEKIFCLAGFSDKIFDLMQVMEKDKRSLVGEIDKVELCAKLNCYS